MSSTFSTNKTLQMPASGSFVNAWASPLNADIDAIDNCFGGTTTINVTGVSAGTYPLTLTQYQPPNIVFSGTMTGNLAYQIPNGVGGVWSISNGTSAAFTLFITSAGGGRNVVIPQGTRAAIVCDGTNVDFSDTTRIPSSFAVSGTITAGAFNVSSDEKLKSNISTIEGALAKLSSLRGVLFTKAGVRAGGVIAQEVAEAIPEGVRADHEGYLSVDPMAVIGVLIEALKEERSARSNLDARLSALEAR